MKAIIMLQRLEDGTIYCRRVRPKYNVNISNCGEAPYWEDGGTVTLEEIDELLNWDDNEQLDELFKENE